MSKITFRADADLVDRLEALEGSKSEVMREALREYLDDTEERSGGADAADTPNAGTPSPSGTDTVGSLDDALAARVDELVTARLDEEFGARRSDATAVGGPRPFGVPGEARDCVPSVNLTVNVDGAGAAVDPSSDASQRAAPAADTQAGAANASRSADAAPDASDEEARGCAQCGEDLSDDHVFCPNCGEKATRRLFCECGDEVRSDWGFCPGCGRRTPAADVLDAP